MKDKTVAALLALFLGGLGVHKFYLDRPGQGLIYLLFCWTFLPAFISLFEGVYYLLMSPREFDLAYNRHFLQGQQAQLGGSHVHHHYGAQSYRQPSVPVYGTRPAHAHPSAPRLDPAEARRHIEELSEMRIAGLLTEDEFEEKRRAIIARM